jgi:8-oxo-dGTP pyrophosphatase MutT (NUDIX family)
LEPLQRDNIRLAATVMIVRDKAGRDSGIEVFMMKRPGKGDFPDLHVFPGGKVDEADWQPGLCPGLTDSEASQRLGIAAGGLRYWVAVARECFEECGVLLARDSAGVIGMPDEQRESLGHSRQQLLTDDLAWHDLLANHQMTIASDRLVYFSHWLTPPSVPRRFDTRFFLAALPEGEVALSDTQETITGEWVEPKTALANHASGVWQMIDPTLRSLETLQGFASVEMALTQVRAEQHVRAWTPALGAQGMQRFRPDFDQ